MAGKGMHRIFQKNLDFPLLGERTGGLNTDTTTRLKTP